MSPVVITGDLNVAPLENDVWSHKQLLKVVSHTPVETALLGKVQASGRWVDVVRQHIPEPEKLYTWWSYRAKDWSLADKGRRLDHIWLDEGLKKGQLYKRRGRTRSPCAGNGHPIMRRSSRLSIYERRNGLASSNSLWARLKSAIDRSRLSDI